MRSQKLTVNIKKITVNSNISGWRLEAAIKHELSQILGSPEMSMKLGTSRTIEYSNTSFSQKKTATEANLGSNIAHSVAGILVS